MKTEKPHPRPSTPTRTLLSAVICSLTVWGNPSGTLASETNAEPGWRPLPLPSDGHIAEDWVHVGWGGFVVDGDSLRTECDPKGLGLLVYKKQRFGNCQIRVVFKSKEAKSNSGIFVRIADGILDQAQTNAIAFRTISAPARVPPTPSATLRRGPARPGPRPRGPSGAAPRAGDRAGPRRR